MACRDRIMLLQKHVLTISASGVNSQIQEKANLSSFPRKEHRFELSNSKKVTYLHAVVHYCAYLYASNYTESYKQIWIIKSQVSYFAAV